MLCSGGGAVPPVGRLVIEVDVLDIGNVAVEEEG